MSDASASRAELRARLLGLLRQSPLIASVQTERGSPIEAPGVLPALAQASLNEGVRVLRLEGVSMIRWARSSTSAFVIGLIKHDSETSSVRITPTLAEVDLLLDAGCETIAFDATSRPRPDGSTPAQIIRKIQAAGRLALADLDGPASLRALLSDASVRPDLLSTTLAGYTESSSARPEAPPDLEFLQTCVETGIPTLGEGRFKSEDEIASAMAQGAVGVVMGGALNDPLKQTRRFMLAARLPQRIAGFDLGGTWMRFRGRNRETGQTLDRRSSTPTDPRARLDWMLACLMEFPVERVGVSTGGVVDPATGRVLHANDLMPGHEGLEFSERSLGVSTFALNDGHTAALAHSDLPWAKSGTVVVLAIGTGLGCGVLHEGRLMIGASGEAPAWNVRRSSRGPSYEEMLGGAHHRSEDAESAWKTRAEVLDELLQEVRAVYASPKIVLAGSVGLRLAPQVQTPHRVTPFGADAGLIGALRLALLGRRPFRNAV